MDGDGFFTVFRLIAGVIAGVAALAAVTVVVRSMRRGALVRELTRSGTRAEGVVVDNQLHSHAPTRTTTPDGFSHSTGGGMTFSPVVRFTDSTGHERVVVGDEEASDSWVEGTALEVLYDPDRPDRVVVDPDSTGVGGTVVAAVLFLAFAVAVVVGVGATVGWSGDPSAPDLLGPGGQQFPGDGFGDLPPGFDQPADPGT